MNRYERSLREARSEGYRLLEQERAKALLERQNQLSALRAEIESSTEEQKSLLRTQSEQARALLESDARKIAADISRQILNRPSPDFTATGVR
jgi:F0F1-type ATP synthase membrane subunit b/b'